MADAKVPAISIDGKASAFARADVGFVDLYTKADGMFLEDAIAESKRKTQAVVDAIRGSVSEIRNIAVSDVQVGQGRPSLPSRDSPRPEVIRNIVVTIPPSIEIAVGIVDSASRLGAFMHNPLANVFSVNPMSAILYGLLECDSIEELAMKNAIENAQKTAARTANLIGKGVGRILHVSKVEISGIGKAPPFGRKQSVDSKFSTDYLSISPERVEVSVFLTIDFELFG